MKVEQIRVDPDPYEPYRLSQGFRVGDLLLVSGQAGQVVIKDPHVPQPGLGGPSDLGDV